MRDFEKFLTGRILILKAFEVANRTFIFLLERASEVRTTNLNIGYFIKRTSHLKSNTLT